MLERVVKMSERRGGERDPPRPPSAPCYARETMRTLPLFVAVIMLSACAAEPTVDDDVVLAPVVASSTEAISARPMSSVGGCRERPRSTMSRALHDAAELFALSRDTRMRLVALVPQPVKRAIWR